MHGSTEFGDKVGEKPENPRGVYVYRMDAADLNFSGTNCTKLNINFQTFLIAKAVVSSAREKLDFFNIILFIRN